MDYKEFFDFILLKLIETEDTIEGGTMCYCNVNMYARKEDYPLFAELVDTNLLVLELKCRNKAKWLPLMMFEYAWLYHTNGYENAFKEWCHFLCNSFTCNIFEWRDHSDDELQEFMKKSCDDLNWVNDTDMGNGDIMRFDPKKRKEDHHQHKMSYQTIIFTLQDIFDGNLGIEIEPENYGPKYLSTAVFDGDVIITKKISGALTKSALKK